MSVSAGASVTVTAFDWVPDFARGQVRDLRVRWALEEAGIDYRERLVSGAQIKQPAYLREQPFGQVPVFADGAATMFESGAIVLHIAQDCDTLLPRDPAARARAISWLFAALNSVEPAVQQLGEIDFFHVGEAWTAERRPQVAATVAQRLDRLAAALGAGPYLDGAFSVGDLMMATVLRILDNTDLVGERPSLRDYLARCTARPAFARALAAQLAAFAPADAARAATV